MPELKKYEVIAETGIQPEGFEATAPQGTVVELTAEQAEPLLASGAIKEHVEAAAPKEGDACTTDDGKPGTIDAAGVCIATPVAAEEAPKPPVEDEAPKKYLGGLLILSEDVRTVNGKDYNHVKLIDGSEQDLTDEQYEEQVKDNA